MLQKNWIELIKLKKLLKKEKIDSIYLGWHRFGPFKEKISLDLLSQYIIILQEFFYNPKKLLIKSFNIPFKTANEAFSSSTRPSIW